MIYIEATVKGEPDVAPFTRIFRYADETEELILNRSVEDIREKIRRKMKLNVNEALLFYVSWLVDEIRARNRSGAIVKNARSILDADQVMVGVPETLRMIILDAVVDGGREKVVLRQPMPASNYMMATKLDGC